MLKNIFLSEKKLLNASLRAKLKYMKFFSLFEERGAAVCFPRFGTHRRRGTEAIEIAGFAVGYGR